MTTRCQFAQHLTSGFRDTVPGRGSWGPGGPQARVRGAQPQHHSSLSPHTGRGRIAPKSSAIRSAGQGRAAPPQSPPRKQARCCLCACMCMPRRATNVSICERACLLPQPSFVVTSGHDQHSLMCPAPHFKVQGQGPWPEVLGARWPPSAGRGRAAPAPQQPLPSYRSGARSPKKLCYPKRGSGARSPAPVPTP